MDAIKKVKVCQSFNKGWRQVPQKDASSVRNEIEKALGITSHNAWLRRLRGTVSPKVSEVISIEEIFKKHGIKDIWGEE